MARAMARLSFAPPKCSVKPVLRTHRSGAYFQTVSEHEGILCLVGRGCPGHFVRSRVPRRYGARYDKIYLDRQAFARKAASPIT